MRRQARSFCSAIFSSRYFDSFLPHDAYAVISAVFAIVRCLSVCQAGVCQSLPSCGVCLSVRRASVTSVYHVKTAEDMAIGTMKWK